MFSNTTPDNIMELKTILEAYRNGERGLPTYAELMTIDAALRAQADAQSVATVIGPNVHGTMELDRHVPAGTKVFTHPAPEAAQELSDEEILETASKYRVSREGGKYEWWEFNHSTNLLDFAHDLLTRSAATVAEQSTANTLAGFQGACAVNGRLPTEQEIWDAGVRSGMRRAQAAQSGQREADVDAIVAAIEPWLRSDLGLRATEQLCSAIEKCIIHWLDCDSRMVLNRAATVLRAAIVAAPTPAARHQDEPRLSDAARDVFLERVRQQSEEGWTPEHDDEHQNGEMADAAGVYALHAGGHDMQMYDGSPSAYWPWDKKWWKPKDKRSNLVRAGALILAEIERIDRAATKGGA